MKTGKMMKLLLILTLMVTLSCGNSNTPGNVALTAHNHLTQGDVDKYVEYVDMTPKEKAQLQALFEAKFNDESERNPLKEKGGIKKVSLISETVTEDGSKADVILNYHYGDGSTSEEKVKCTKVEDRWLLDNPFKAK